MTRRAAHIAHCLAAAALLLHAAAAGAAPEDEATAPPTAPRAEETLLPAVSGDVEEVFDREPDEDDELTGLEREVTEEVVGGQEAKDEELTGLERDVGYLDYVKWRFTAGSRFVPPSDFGGYDATIHQPGFRARLTLPLSENSGVRVSATYDPLIMDFDGITNLFGTGPTPGEPVSTLQAWTVRLQGAYIFRDRFSLFAREEHWSLLGELNLRARYEDGSSLNEGLGLGGALAVGYEIPGKLQLAAGLTLKSSITEFGLGVGPYAEFDWRVDPRWRVRSKGTGAQIEYAATQDLVLFSRAQLQNSSFRLDDRPGVRSPSLRLRQVPAGLGSRWNFTRLFRLEGVFGAMAYQQLRVKDDDGDVLSSASSNPVPYVELRIDYRPGAR